MRYETPLRRRGIAALTRRAMRADVARLRLADKIPHVGLEQVALEKGVQRGGRHLDYVSGVASVALLERQTRISIGQTLGSRVRERDHAADIVADLAGVEARRGDVPAKIGSQRRVAQYRGNAAQLVTVRVDLGHLHLDDMEDRRRKVRQNARSIELVE